MNMVTQATISADIISSTVLSVDSMYELSNSLKSFIGEVEMNFGGSWGRLIKGDTLEFVMDRPEQALRVAFMLKAYVKSLALDSTPKAEKFRRKAVRIAIGIGSMRMVDRENDFMDGEAIYLSGRGLADNKRGADLMKIFGSVCEVHPELNIMAAMTNNMFFKARERACGVLYYKLFGYSQKEIADKLDISISAVSQSLSSIGWEAIESFLKYYESTVI